MTAFALDEIDRTILRLLQEDARISNAEIGRRVDRAPSAIYQRVRKLEERGLIKGYHARVDPKALGFGLMAFVMIRTGEGEVRTEDTESLGELLDHRIQALPDVSGTRTTIVVQTAKESWTLPVDHGEAEDGSRPGPEDGRRLAGTTV